MKISVFSFLKTDEVDISLWMVFTFFNVTNLYLSCVVGLHGNRHWLALMHPVRSRMV